MYHYIGKRGGVTICDSFKWINSLEIFFTLYGSSFFVFSINDTSLSNTIGGAFNETETISYADCGFAIKNETFPWRIM